MMGDSVGADVHAGGDLVVVQPFGDQAGDGSLGFGQAVPPGDGPGGGRAPVTAADAEPAQPSPDAGLVTVGADLAVRHLKEALGAYRQAGAERDQARTRRRLRQLGIRRRHWSTPAARPVTGWDSLTGTEQAVAGLVAEGLNNNQVAARMYISTHTVAHHLRQAFRKLSIASRVELTRIVIEQRS